MASAWQKHLIIRGPLDGGARDHDLTGWFEGIFAASPLFTHIKDRPTIDGDEILPTRLPLPRTNTRHRSIRGESLTRRRFGTGRDARNESINPSVCKCRYCLPPGFCRSTVLFKRRGIRQDPYSVLFDTFDPLLCAPFALGSRGEGGNRADPPFCPKDKQKYHRDMDSRLVPSPRAGSVACHLPLTCRLMFLWDKPPITSPPAERPRAGGRGGRCATNAAASTACVL
ncbi:hypothetical protein B0H66DRAFT_201102 [Apodospora peruviana]|uniref:Uncharacterized protein n=1 Tax=Apodospora peruviana TaxID=516989 RepID=A0AAE0IC33_9PEZI|nr:hypothetical protein B0H66DRAFT_201102 [Apodospora peruviana]